MSPPNIQTFAKIDTEYSADAVEFCPNPHYTDIVAVGTYQVVKPDETTASPQTDADNEVVEEGKVATKRKGRLLLYQVTGRDGKIDDGENMEDVSLHTEYHAHRRNVCQIETAAILDMKW
ncbi:hypothetical protein HK104_000413 [Borealophlyctis nickersoniae]|nr:hypothetical protein HK104_000413 [Borealophlyctis nickersoniae]